MRIHLLYDRRDDEDHALREQEDQRASERTGETSFDPQEAPGAGEAEQDLCEQCDGGGSQLESGEGKDRKPECVFRFAIVLARMEVNPPVYRQTRPQILVRDVDIVVMPYHRIGFAVFHV